MSQVINPIKDTKTIKKDRMRFTKNTLSSTLCYLAILFNVFYFVNLYSTNDKFYYNMQIGFSIIYNLLFLLFAFLCSEGVKNYSKGYSIVISVMGLMQFVRIFGIPTSAYSEPDIMGDKQFLLICAYLIISASCCLASGIIGYIKHTTLEEYKKETGLA